MKQTSIGSGWTSRTRAGLTCIVQGSRHREDAAAYTKVLFFSPAITCMNLFNDALNGRYVFAPYGYPPPPSPGLYVPVMSRACQGRLSTPATHRIFSEISDPIHETPNLPKIHRQNLPDFARPFPLLTNNPQKRTYNETTTK